MLDCPCEGHHRIRGQVCGFGLTIPFSTAAQADTKALGMYYPARPCWFPLDSHLGRSSFLLHYLYCFSAQGQPSSLQLMGHQPPTLSSFAHLLSCPKPFGLVQAQRRGQEQQAKLPDAMWEWHCESKVPSLKTLLPLQQGWERSGPTSHYDHRAWSQGSQVLRVSVKD